MYANARISIRLPDEYLNFVQAYAHQRQTTVSELLVGFIKRLKRDTEVSEEGIAPEVGQMIGIIPMPESSIGDYYDHLAEKHS